MSADDDLDSEDLREELVVSGSIYLDPAREIAVEVRRGMTILTGNGREVGNVAAVIIDKHAQKVTHLLLGRLSQIPEYCRVSIDFIVQVRDEHVLLCIFDEVVNNLPTWHES